ncbi:hypothetical protein M0805_006399 [Coniferiporia weirii]|nr:hypothetical protein M0805_006399 [Coniferiporia weirii]
MSSSSPSSPSQSTFGAVQAPTPPTLITFLNNVPPQLTVLLVELGPYIARIRWIAEAASWKMSYGNSWLLLGAWWALCLLSEFSLRFLLPPIAAVLYAYLSRSSESPKVRQAVTEQTLQSIVIDLSVIESLLFSLPALPPSSWRTLARVFSILYIPFLILTWFMRLKLLIGVLGTILLTWRAQWATTARAVLWRSAWFRWGLSRLWAMLSGQLPEPIALTSSSAFQSGESSHSVRFLILVYESQRWWVGLDWTAALLPGERPSWCSASLEPLSPPSAFALPEPTCVFVGDGKGGLVKRTASWTWEESEWKVVVKKDAGTRRIEKELPVLKEDTSMHANRIGRTKQKIHEVGEKLKKPFEGDNGDADALDAALPGTIVAGTSNDVDVNDSDQDEHFTDNDGWVYGDNKWKATSSSGGLGKYTRFRKWSRIALLTEVVEAASAEEAVSYAVRQREASSGRTEDEAKDGNLGRQSLDSIQSRRSVDENDDAGDEGGLRKRLRAVISKSTSSV